MTTLSKEDVVRMAYEADMYIPNGLPSDWDNGDYICTADNLQLFATLARADLVAENERLKQREQKLSDVLINANRTTERRGKERDELRDQLTATRTALAAAEARGKLQIDALLTCQKKQIINECAPSVNYKTFDSDLVAKAIAQPRDDSALREMIAGVYEECAKVCLERAANHASEIRESEADDCAFSIRALAEKAKGE